MRKLAFFSLTIIFTLTFCGMVFALTPTSEFYVNDYANVINDTQEQEMVSAGEQLFNQNGVQVVCVTVDSLDGKDIDSYATSVYNDFKIGTSKDDSGVLLLCSVNDGEVQISVGDGLSGEIPDSKAGSILDQYFKPEASKGDYSDAFYDTYMDLINIGYSADTSGAPVFTGLSAWDIIIGAVIIFGALALLYGFFSYLRMKKGSSNSPMPTYEKVGGNTPNQGPINFASKPANENKSQSNHNSTPNDPNDGMITIDQLENQSQNNDYNENDDNLYRQQNSGQNPYQYGNVPVRPVVRVRPGGFVRRQVRRDIFLGGATRPPSIGGRGLGGGLGGGRNRGGGGHSSGGGAGRKF